MSTVITSVDPHSPAARAHIKPGEQLLAINGHRIVDVLDYRFYGYDPAAELLLRREDGSEHTVRVRKPEGQDLGLNFETYLMDRARSCANNCIFCFVDQMPKGLRKSLYFKDDDARLSFLMGNYITLTNMSPRAVQRIIDLRISPINVSVHTTDPELRAMMLGNPRAGESITVMRRLAENGIRMNCQVVACPGINDGPQLRRTMEDLSSMHPGVTSVAIVPVGLTRYREGLYPLEQYNAETASAVIDLVENYAKGCRDRFGTSLFWCSDEFYLLSGRELPSEDYYESFNQLENGVGMLRLLESEFIAALRLLDEAPSPSPFTIATGLDAAPMLTRLVDLAQEKFPQLQGQVVPIVNCFFGEQIVVSGLITGQDLIAQLSGRDLGQRLLLPDNMLRYHENVFLDDVTIRQVEDALGVPLTFVPQDGFELCDAMFGLNDSQKQSRPAADENEYYTYNPSH
ncbi:MAG: DUF512 domain-containing protein [Oscillospiraceae bacterium]|nr:DUF512 domain-containing protein [Oscillospiraceae bacterium]